MILVNMTKGNDKGQITKRHHPTISKSNYTRGKSSSLATVLIYLLAFSKDSAAA